MTSMKEYKLNEEEILSLLLSNPLFRLNVYLAYLFHRFYHKKYNKV